MDRRTDVYSLAVSLFEALTGEVPFRGDSAPARMTAKLHEPPPSLCERAPWLPATLEEVLARGMATAPGDRYQSAGELGRALLAAVGERPPPLPAPAPGAPPASPPAPTTPATGQPARAAPPAPARRPPRAQNPRRALAGAAVIVAAALGALALSGVFSGDDGAPGRGAAPSAPARAAAVSESDAREVVTRFGEAYREEDLDAVMTTLADDPRFVFDSPRTGTLTRDGRERIGQEFSAVWAASENYRLTVTGIDRHDDVTIVTGRFSQEVPLTKERPAGPVTFEVVAAGGGALIRKIHSRVDF